MEQAHRAVQHAAEAKPSARRGRRRREAGTTPRRAGLKEDFSATPLLTHAHTQVKNTLDELKSSDFTAADDPFSLFEAWQAAAARSELNDPTAMAVATVDGNGLPDLRMVLCKDVSPRGFVFYTNFESAKGRELSTAPKAAALFHWKSQRKQVRVRGPVEVVSDAEADDYFASRPRGSRLGAHASQQSRPLTDRATLERAVSEVDAAYPDAVPRPQNWSGFRIRPLQIEFWSDGAHRLHDRILFSRADLQASWSKARLYP